MRSKTLAAMPIRMKTITTAFSTSAAAKLRKMAMGSVSVFILVAPASVTDAPNSPTALAQHKMIAESSPFLANGNVV